MGKYKVMASISTVANKSIGEVEFDTLEEFRSKAEQLWEAQGYDYPTTNITNDFDLNDWELSELNEEDLRFYLNEPASS